MIKEKEMYTYQPDYVVSPGEVLEETLEARGIRKTELAARCGLSGKTMSLILGGKAPVSPETAIQLERVLGVSASIWNNLEAKFRLQRARNEDFEELGKHGEWLAKFPIRELERRHILERGADPGKQVGQLLDFFEVGSVASWEQRYERLQVAFRRSTAFDTSPISVVTWLRMGERKAEKVQCAPFNKSRFDAALDEIRRLSCEDVRVFESKMKGLCSGSGVALVFVEELPGTHLSGATRWLSQDKAMIELSLRYKTDDHLWFTFFHEAAHIRLGGKKEIFVDEMDETAPDEEEREADRFAAERLIPAKSYAEFREKGQFNESSTRRFARTIGIAPGIVVGRLQHDGLVSWRSTLNSLKCHFKLVESANK